MTPTTLSVEFLQLRPPLLALRLPPLVQESPPLLPSARPMMIVLVSPLLAAKYSFANYLLSALESCPTGVTCCNLSNNQCVNDPHDTICGIPPTKTTLTKTKTTGTGKPTSTPQCKTNDDCPGNSYALAC
jgi:hypothetical protein